MPHPKFLDIGSVYGRWTVVSFCENDPRPGLFYECRCACGRGQIVKSCNLSAGRSTQCHPCSRQGIRVKLSLPRPRAVAGDSINGWTLLDKKWVRYSDKVYQGAWACPSGHEHWMSASGAKRGVKCPLCRNKHFEQSVQNHVWSGIRAGALARRLVFELEKDQAFALLDAQDWKCALSGLPLKLASNHRLQKLGETTASLDRIDSAKGYWVDNVQWVHVHINAMKNNFDNEVFKALCRCVAVVHPHEQQGEVLLRPRNQWRQVRTTVEA